MRVVGNLEIDDFADYASKGTIEKGQKITGVLLKFHSEGLFDRASNVRLEDPYAFYVDYLGKNARYYNGDGMEFNTVLYVPDVIRTVYKGFGGVNPDSGNPFWWYMDVFLGMDMNTVRSSWNETIRLLVGKKGMKLPYPRGDESGNHGWGSRKSSIKGWKGYFYNAETGKYSVKVEKPTYTMDINPKSQSEKLFLPAMLTKVYVAGGGDYRNTTESFYWYMETYHETTRKSIDSMVADGSLEEYLQKLDYIEPKESDVNENCMPIVSTNIEEGSSLKFASVYYYDGPVLQFSDGSLIKDTNRLYFVDNGQSFVVFIPKSYIEPIESNVGGNWKWNGNGDLFWNLLKLYELEVDTDFLFTREYIEKNLRSKRIVNGLVESL